MAADRRGGCSYAGYRETRHRGTIGGSLAFAAPWAELTAVTVALDATIEVALRARRPLDRRARVLPRPERDCARGRRADHRRPLPRPPGAHWICLSRGQRPVSRLCAGRRGGGRHARRRRCGRLGDARAAARRGDAAPGRHRRDRARNGARRGHPRGRDGADRRARSPGRRRGLAAPTGAGSPASSRDARCWTPPRAPQRRRHRDRRDTATHPVRVQVNGTWREGSRRAAPHARRLPARGSRPDGHASRLRARLLRELQRAARRAGRALVPDARGAGRRPRGRDGRGTRRARRHAVRAPAGVHREPRPAVRVLHARDADDRASSSCAHIPRAAATTQIREAISGVTCRCTGYQQIVESIQAASQAASPAPSREVPGDHRAGS